MYVINGEKFFPALCELQKTADKPTMELIDKIFYMAQGYAGVDSRVESMISLCNLFISKYESKIENLKDSEDVTEEELGWMKGAMFAYKFINEDLESSVGPWDTKGEGHTEEVFK